jgi:hypothetical protein
MKFARVCVSSLPFLRPTRVSPCHPTVACQASCAFTPDDVAAIFGLRITIRRLVPSSWFCTTSTAFPAQGFRACCIPVPERVRLVSAIEPPLAALNQNELAPALPPVSPTRSRGAPHTPRRSPPTRSSLPCDSFRSHHCDRCLHVVAPPVHSGLLLLRSDDSRPRGLALRVGP